jgi:glycosyltransferase involved in cell wall biosynthesis
VPYSNTEFTSDHSTKTCLQVLPELGTGGVERGTIDIAEALVNAGWRALVASAGGTRVRELELVGAEHITLPLSSKSPFTIRKNSRLLVDLIAQNSVDIIHARSRAPGWSARRAARIQNRPFVTTFHGVYGLGLFGVKKLYNQIMTTGDPVIAISDFIANHLIQEYGVDVDRIRVIPRGVDLGLFDPESVTSARIIDLATEWRLPDDGLVIMLPGRLTSWKGQSLLVDALSYLNKTGQLSSGWRCLFIGPRSSKSAYRHRLDAHIDANGLSGHIQIIEDCRDIAAAYMVTDVVISASTRPEAFGRVVAEAQAMGRPVVAPAHGAAPEILLPGVTGWLFTPGDAKSLAGAIQQAISISSSERSILASRARDQVFERFNHIEMAQATLCVYDEILKKHSHSDIDSP